MIYLNFKVIGNHQFIMIIYPKVYSLMKNNNCKINNLKVSIKENKKNIKYKNINNIFLSTISGTNYNEK